MFDGEGHVVNESLPMGYGSSIRQASRRVLYSFLPCAQRGNRLGQ
jgi:hypothetical protein